MGEVPFFDRFRSRTKSEQGQGAAVPPRPAVNGGGISREDKLAIVEELESSGLGWFWATDDAGRVTYLSPNILAGFNKSLDDLAGRTLQSLFTPLSRDSEARSLNLKLGSRKPFGNFTVQAIDAPSTIVLRLSGRPAFRPDGQFLGFRGSGLDITEEYCTEEEAARLARYDTLTGLANRHRMAQVIDSTLQAFSAAERTCTLLMLDLDRFKQVNDTLGHAAGDQLLVQVARRLESVIGSRGEIGRLGGDEFQILVPDIDDRGRLGEMAKKIITMLSQPYSVEEGRCTIGASVGMAIAPYDGVGRDELTRAADLALYAAKNGGRGQFRFYGADLELDDQLRKRMEEDLSHAIEAGRMAVEYQPVVSLANDRVIGLQA
ncbi:MAG TPA: diguanylate cyclase, partial [Lautropia sp.]|nr:diguanylate cyclase [Lautropia sp.]